jgi:hypothetical protein
MPVGQGVHRRRPATCVSCGPDEVFDIAVRISLWLDRRRCVAVFVGQRRANARPMTSVLSNRTAVDSSRNSTMTTGDQGRCWTVWPDGPALCHSMRFSTSLVRLTKVRIHLAAVCKRISDYATHA